MNIADAAKKLLRINYASLLYRGSIFSRDCAELILQRLFSMDMLDVIGRSHPPLLKSRGNNYSRQQIISKFPEACKGYSNTNFAAYVESYGDVVHIYSDELYTYTAGKLTSQLSIFHPTHIANGILLNIYESYGHYYVKGLIDGKIVKLPGLKLYISSLVVSLMVVRCGMIIIDTPIRSVLYNIHSDVGIHIGQPKWTCDNMELRRYYFV